MLDEKEAEWMKTRELLSLEEKIKALKATTKDSSEEKSHKKNLSLVKNMSLWHQIAFESLYIIGQGARIFAGSMARKMDFEALLERLVEVEKFYFPMGGIIGYHNKFIELLSKKKGRSIPARVQYERPPGIDLTRKTKQIASFIRAGIEGLPKMGEIYPVAGAADRLCLIDEKTKEPLPAAELPFLGRTLLEGLIRDLAAREHLYYSLTGKQVITPILLMTSEEKNNEAHIRQILEKNNWFGRPKNKFFFMRQPLVPLIDIKGLWVLKSPLQLHLKPGGHGVLWKLAQETGAIAWLKKQKREKVLVRQINNPMAGIDHGLSALTGIGILENRSFGFASCERLVDSAEGMDVLIERKSPLGYQTLISNIEYTDFELQGIEDVPKSVKSPYSKFPSNTNILFADLSEIEKIAKLHPIPGLILNMKGVESSRLESTMQNIADYIQTDSKQRLSAREKENLKTFVTYNARHKTIGVAKKMYTPGKSIRDTPFGALYDVLKNSRELLLLCGVAAPSLPSEDDFAEKGPSFLFTYHPALGPFYSLIKKKIRKGILHPNAELKLEIADILIENFSLKGSLFVEADQIMGHNTASGKLVYSEKKGKCRLKNIKVENLGINKSQNNCYWKYDITRNESLTIKLLGSSEFVAENVTFRGHQEIIVPDSHRMTAVQKGSQIHFKLEKIVALPL